MRHGWMVFLLLSFLSLGPLGFARQARGGEPLDQRLGIRTAPIFLLTRSDVQTDLKLDSKQVAECHRAALTLYRKATGLKGKTGPAMVAARRAIDEELSEWLSNNLSPGQLARLDQIDLQWEGASAMLSRPMLDEHLSLTPDQRERVAQCISAKKAQRAQGAWTYADHVELTRTAIAVLSKRQRDLWIHVLGPACRFTIGVNPQTPHSPAQPAREVETENRSGEHLP
jgi:hypothetical protein